MTGQSSPYIYDIGGDAKGIIGDVKGGVIHQYIIAQKSEAKIHSQRLIRGSPYLGLKKFEPEDKDKFFGREQWITTLSKDLEQDNLLLLLGASGSGKSSLVQAGIIPYLSDEWGTSKFEKFIFVPDKNPFESLYNSLINKYKNTATKIINQKNHDGLIKLIDDLKEKSHQWLIFIDQFEEIFTSTSKLKRDQFIADIVSLMKQQYSSVKLIMALRSDFLDNLREYGDFTNEVESQIRLIRNMTESELRLAIAEPAARNGVTFEKDLVKQIISDFYKQAGSLPLLQYTLDLLWEKSDIFDDNRVLLFKTYDDLGGVSGALQQQANYIYKEKLNDEEKKAAEKIFIELIDLAVKEPVSRRVEQSQFRNDPIKESALNKLIESRLLVSGRNEETEETTVEVAHEQLLRSWGFILNLIREKEEIVMLRSRLIADANQWYELRKEDKEKAKYELWDGYKLERVLKLINEKAFGSLDEKSKQFILASVERRDIEKEERERRELEKLEAKVALETAEKKNRTLTEANQKAKKRVMLGSIIGATILVVTLVWTSIVVKQTKGRVAKLRVTLEETEKFRRVDSLVVAKKYNKALSEANRNINRNPESFLGFAKRGEIYELMGDNEKALADLNHAIELNPVDEWIDWIYTHRGLVYKDMNRYDEALADFNRALELNPNADWILINRASTYREMDFYEKALADLNRALELQPNDDWFLTHRGLTYKDMNRYEKALADLNRALELNPNNDWILTHRASTYREMDFYEKALADLNRGLELDPNNDWILTHRGLTYKDMNRYDEALADFNRAIELDPYNNRAIEERDQLYKEVLSR